MAETVGLHDVRYGREGHNHLHIEVDASNPYFTFDPKACIVCSRCVRACDEIQGTLALDRRGSRLRVDDLGVRHVVHGVRVRLVRRLRAGLPDDGAAGEEHHRARHADPHGQDDVRLLRCRLLVRRRDEGRRARAHDAVEGRRRQRGPLVRQGSLRVGLRHPRRARHRSDGARVDHRPVARGVVGRGDRLHRRALQGDCSSSTAPTRSAASRRRAARTKRSSSCRRWCARRSATTTSTPARGSATRPPATA